MVQKYNFEPSKKSRNTTYMVQKSKLEPSRKSLKLRWFKSLNLNQVGKV